MVSGSLSLPCSGFFSPFPHGTCPLSVSQEYLALADGPAEFVQGFTCPALLRIPLWSMFFTCTGLSPSMAALSKAFQFIARPIAWSYDPNKPVSLLVWANARSLATTCAITVVFFSSGYLDVSVLRVRPTPESVVLRLQRSGLPHWDTCGSTRMCRSPQLFAACRVLLRL